MKNILFLLCAALLMCAPVFPASLEELAGPERAALLAAGTGPITEVQLKKPVPLLVPRHDELRQLLAGTMESLDPNIFVETLYQYRKPRTAADGGPEQWSDAERADVFNQLLALSTLTGIQYYSASRKAMRTLYEYSQVIDSPESKKPLPDPVYAAPPVSLSLYARQKDLTFGDNIYRYHYSAAADACFFVQNNLTSMNAGIIPAVGKNKFVTVMAVIDSGDSLLIYAAAMVKAASFPGLGERISNSFTNRAQAILKWFEGRADAVFGRY